MLSGEKTILERAQRGDAEAFGEIYDSYVPRIFRFAFLKIGSRENAEDLTSETFLRFWTYIRKEEIESDTAEPILYRIARNLIIDFYRKKEIAVQEIDDEVANCLKDERSDFAKELMEREEIREMMEMLKEIKDEYQEIIILRYVEGFSPEEIANITGKSKGSVRVLSHRALKSLEKVMKMKKDKII
jgi:RNA polymerase sigma-70 factor (ECF subfamily)